MKKINLIKLYVVCQAIFAAHVAASPFPDEHSATDVARGPSRAQRFLDASRAKCALAYQYVFTKSINIYNQAVDDLIDTILFPAFFSS
jgi:hypothetical protein